MPEPQSDPTNVPLTRESDIPKYVWIPGLCFAALCLVFVMIAFFLRPDLTEDQRKIFNIIFPFLAGAGTTFLGGAAAIKVSGSTGLFSYSFSAAAGVAVFVFVFMHPVFKDGVDPKPLTADAQLVVVKSAIGDLRQYVESLELPASVEQLKSKAEPLAERILAFDDATLSAIRVFMKYQYATFAYVSAAAAHERAEEKSETSRLAGNAVENADKALRWADRVIQEQSGNTAVEFQNWLSSDSGTDRVLYLKAMALCMSAGASADPAEAEEANKVWRKLSASYRMKYPAESTPQLKCIAEDAKESV